MNLKQKYMQTTLLLACLMPSIAVSNEPFVPEDKAELSDALQLARSGRNDEAMAALADVRTERAFNLNAQLRISDSQNEEALQLFDETLDAHPDSCYTRMNRIILFCDLGRYEAAIRDIDLLKQYVSASAIPLKVGQAHGVALLETGRWEKAGEVFLQLLKREPGFIPAIDGMLVVASQANDRKALHRWMDAASKSLIEKERFDSSEILVVDEVSPAAIAGLDQLLITHPMLRVGMESSSKMKDWFASRLFDINGHPIVRLTPAKVPGASIAASRRSKSGAVKSGAVKSGAVKSGAVKSGAVKSDANEILIELEAAAGPDASFADRLWQSIAFELFNLANMDQTHKLNQRVTAGDITLSEYVAVVTRREHLNLLRTRCLYTKVVVPSLREQSMTTNPMLWYPKIPSDFVSYFEKFERNDFYPWVYYSRRYQLARFPGYWPTEDRPIPAKSDD